MELSAFLQFRLKPVSEELSASGAGHVIIAYVPASGSMTVISDRTEIEKAHLMKTIAEVLLMQAERLAKAADGSIIMPGLPGLPGSKAS